MIPPPLAIIQARMGSTRLPGKVLLPIAGKRMVQHVYERAVEAFGKEHVVAAIPKTPDNEPLRDVLTGLGATVFQWDGDEADVLGRFHACAHTYRWRPESVIVRVTADDPFKDPSMMRRVAEGERLPVELGAEAFTLAMLDAAHTRLNVWDGSRELREHITRALFPVAPPPAPSGCWTVDTPEDYADVRDFAAPIAPGIMAAPSRRARRRVVEEAGT